MWPTSRLRARKRDSAVAPPDQLIRAFASGPDHSSLPDPAIAMSNARLQLAHTRVGGSLAFSRSDQSGAEKMRSQRMAVKKGIGRTLLLSKL